MYMVPPTQAVTYETPALNKTMPAVTRKMANDARNGINTVKLTDQDYELLNIPRKACAEMRDL